MKKEDGSVSLLHAELYVPEGNDPDQVTLKVLFEDRIEQAENGDFFDCLADLRNRLSERWIFLCKGACLNVFPSGMQREMGKGQAAYALTLGKRSRMEDRVNIFEIADLKDVATVEDQAVFYDKWLESAKVDVR